MTVAAFFFFFLEAADEVGAEVVGTAVEEDDAALPEKMESISKAAEGAGGLETDGLVRLALSEAVEDDAAAVRAGEAVAGLEGLEESLVFDDRWEEGADLELEVSLGMGVETMSAW